MTPLETFRSDAGAAVTCLSAVFLFCLALAGCASLRSYAQDPAKADAYRAKYASDCQGALHEPSSATGEGKHGSLLKSVIREVIGRNIESVRRCYREARGAWPELEGRVVLKFVIRPDGKVGDVAIVDNDTRVDAVACCIRGTTRGWVFPPPEGGGRVVVTYPFVLNIDAWFTHPPD